jgi:hypothetical protein
LIFYEDFNLCIKAYLEFKLSKALERVKLEKERKKKFKEDKRRQMINPKSTEFSQKGVSGELKG